MHHFWESIIGPVFKIFQPRNIIEIGADYGYNTHNILAYCREEGARAHVIDPLPKFDVTALQEEYGGNLIFYKTLSLNALPLIQKMDAVLIDGDHNWYTVYHELKLIEKSCRKNGAGYPLIFLHDIDWPYARRDMYYFPDNIPEAFRKPFRQKGISPDDVELKDEGGLNPHLNNAIYAHDYQNGILTAVEDFLQEAETSLALTKIKGLHGLGFIYPSELINKSSAFARFIEQLTISDQMSRVLSTIEGERIKSHIAGEETRQKLRDSENQRKRENEEAERQLKEEAKKIEQKKAEKDELKAEAETLKAEKDELKAERQHLREKSEHLRTELESSRTAVREGEQKAARLEEKYKKQLRDSEDLRNREYHQLAQKNQQIVRWMEQLNFQFNELMGSRRWRLGNGLIDTATLSGWRRKPPMATDHMRRIFETFNRFKQDMNPAAVTPPPLSPKTTEPLKDQPKRKHNLTVAVIAWDVGHNPLGRAYMLAEALSRNFNVVLLGPNFPRYNNKVWEPLRNGKIPVLPLPGKSFPEFHEVLESVSSRLEADIIVACKPRLPSVQLGLMMKAFKNRPLFIDIDDYELSFFKNRTSLSLAEISKNSSKFNDLHLPFEETWTRFTENLLGYADGILVSNPELHKKFGGTLIPHARDENSFDPSLYDKKKRRLELGLAAEDKVVLFLGTPREHKGVTELLEAVRSCGKEDYKLCIIGTPPDKAYAGKLKRLGGDNLVMLDNQPFQNLPENLLVGDVVCLLQNPESEISRYQLPAKVIDAIAMGIPVMATPTPPLQPLIDAGAVEAVAGKDLKKKLCTILANIDEYRLKGTNCRSTFLQDYSYRAISDKLTDRFVEALENFQELPGEALSFIGIQPQKEQADASARQDKGGLDIVLFWKQNDTGLYGRRSDMMIKYLANRPEVRKIAVFDPPISIENLRDKANQTGTVHDRMIYESTMLRHWGVKDTEKVSYHVFIYSSNGRDADKQICPYPKLNHYLKYMEKHLEQAEIDPGQALFWFYPENKMISRIQKHFQPHFNIIDLVDDHRTWPDLPELRRLQLTRHYKEVLKNADLALANCQKVKTSMQQYCRDIMLVPNGCELEPPPDISDNPHFKAFRNLEGPKLGYVGNLEKDKIDVELIKYLAEKRSDWQIILIGSTHANQKILELNEYSNVHFMGVVKYPEVRAWIKEFDVAILPHLNSEKTQSMNPLKLYVYCSLGVPVVSTNIENLDELKSHIAIAENPDDFFKAAEKMVNEGHEAVSGELRQCLEKNTWEVRIGEIFSEINRRI